MGLKGISWNFNLPNVFIILCEIFILLVRVQNNVDLFNHSVWNLESPLKWERRNTKRKTNQGKSNDKRKKETTKQEIKTSMLSEIQWNFLFCGKATLLRLVIVQSGILERKIINTNVLRYFSLQHDSTITRCRKSDTKERVLHWQRHGCRYVWPNLFLEVTVQCHLNRKLRLNVSLIRPNYPKINTRLVIGIRCINVPV